MALGIKAYFPERECPTVLLTPSLNLKFHVFITFKKKAKDVVLVIYACMCV